MAKRVEKITGQRFGRLLATGGKRRLDPKHTVLEFQCDCGNLVEVDRTAVVTGRTSSCGCLRSELVSQRMTKHGMTPRSGHHPLYDIWVAMHQRCENSNVVNYENYGGRGIKVSKEWFDFATFVHDMGPKPTPEHTLERSNNNGNYCKENCCWATRKEQSANTCGWGNAKRRNLIMSL
jgi:hypothetical protein